MEAELERVLHDTCRVLYKFGASNPDYTEWQDLKNSLLRLHPFLKGESRAVVGHACSDFNETLAKWKADNGQ